MKYIKIKAKPVSINKAYYAKRKVLNSDSRAFRETFMQQLQESSNSNILSDVQNNFNRKKHSLKINITIQVPLDVFITKAGYISRKGGDVDNFLKLILDFLTNERYNNRIFNCGNCTNLNIDDQYVTDLNIRKIASPDKYWYILIGITPIPL